jgi:hypothetical protein
MKKIILMTSGKINYQLPKLSLYESISVTAKGKQFPHLASAGNEYIQTLASKIGPQISRLYFAPSHQCQDTARYFSNPKTSLDLLLPLKFDLSALVSQEESVELGLKFFDTLRRRYLLAFFSNKLMEDNHQICARYHKLVELCQPNSTTLVISHAYLIKQFQAYHILGSRMFTDYQALSNIFKPELETMSRLETVDIIIN